MDKKINDSIKYVCGGMLISSFSSAMYLIILPLYIYHLTNSAISTALQVTISSFGSLLSCFFVNNFNIFKNDKNHIFAINISLCLLLCLTLFFDGKNIIYWLYFVSFLGTFLDTCASGYIESLIAFVSKETGRNRQSIIGKTKIFSGLGSAVGFFVGGIVLIFLDYKTVFVVSGILFLISGFVINAIPVEDAKERSNKIKKAVYKILFSKNIFYLSLSHAVSAISLFMYNGTFIYILKNIYKVDDIYVSFYFVMVMIASILGSLLMVNVSKHKELPVFFAPHLRLFYALFFFITAFSFNYWYFLLSAFMLNLIHSFCIPFWQDCFQRYSPSSEWKVVGTSRKTLVAISGILGSFLGGYFIGTYNIMFTYIFAAILCALSSVFLVIFVRKSYEIKENI